MVNIMIFMLLITFIFISLLCVIPIINMQKKKDREKASPFECGFDPFSKPRISFSIHFFSVGLMFLIFDIEITLIMPTPIITSFITMNHWWYSCTFLFLMLIMGLSIEWKEGSMNWT